MLQKLNERVQGVIAWLVIILIAITFTLFGLDYYLQSHQTSKAKVTVNGEPLNNQTYEVNYRRLRAQQNATGMTNADDKKIQAQVLEQMITNEVAIQSARKYGFEVTTEEANSAIVSIPQFQEDGHFSAQKYQQALSGALFTPESFQNEVRQGMLLNQQRFAFMATAFALPSEIERFVRLYMQTRDYEYVVIHAAPYEKNVVLSNEAIQSYYNNHKKDFLSPEKVSLDYVVLSLQDIKSKLKVSDEKIRRYYEENQNNYLTPAQWQVAHILFSVPEGASDEQLSLIQQKADKVYEELDKNPSAFNKLVAKYSDDKLSVAENGVLPWIMAGQQEYDAVLSKLTSPGQISKPEKTAHGYEIYKLIAYKPVSKKSLKDVADIIKEQLITERAQNKYTRALEQLSDLSYQSPDTLVPVADALKLKINQTELFPLTGGTTDFTKNKLVSNAAFSHDVLKLSNNSEPIQLENDVVAVIRVDQHVPAKELSLAEVRDQIKTILTKQAAAKKAQEIADALLNPVENKAHLAMIHTGKLQWKSITAAAREYDKVNSAINELAFNLAKPESKDSVSLADGDYAIVRLKRIIDGKIDALDKEHRDSLVQQIESNYGMVYYDLYVSSLMKKASIVRN